ncbi:MULTISPECIES: PhnD/SsuA/transferrin family substrate-binding protein [unclassified Corallococcus]|uniref:PhnD/SsuA/transferrin family substrate-binding protein n=1 Tax=unclassified Corallococcus TaxID=2685029 RepID=UPI001A8DA14A|nr:PhnD/SsuA/transferrin family substrate-binding protein [Corallococcus sp. NCRR]MBN9682250.1 PhnD/SsuA/transferrin family substrate-binding protein [Corallococcus sp. NCSPR001]WAS86192.1 PhnD/SsuA/transferrin family substrate-binding protein [Corallococcus sp. NCRR]
MTASNAPIRCLLYPSLGEVREHVRVELFARALSERMGRPVVMSMAPTYEYLEAELAAGRVEMAWGTAEQCNAFEPQARAVLRAVRSGSCYYHAALICRADEPLTLETLAGKRVAWVAPRSTGGHLLPVRHLESLGLRPDALFSEQRFLGTYRKALDAVMRGESDLCALFCNHKDAHAMRATLTTYLGADAPRLTPFLFTIPTLADGLILTKRMPEADAQALISVLTRMNTDGAGLEMLMGPFRVETFVRSPGLDAPASGPRPSGAAEYVAGELDAEGRCLRLWSPSGRAFGLSMRGAEGRKLEEVLGSAASKPLMSLLDAVLRGGSDGRLEYRLTVNGDERVYAAEITPCEPSPGDTGVRLGLLVRDVSGLRALEDPLYRLASFPLLHPEPLLELGMDGELRYANPATHAAFQDLVEKGAEHPLVKAAIVWAWRGAPPGEPPPTVHLDGRYWELTIAQLWDPPGLRVFARDVTLRKQLEARLFQADRLSALGSLAAAVGHEMNNPLAFVLANLSYIREEMDRLKQPLLDGRPVPRADLDDMLEALGETVEGATRLKHIVQDLRTLSRKPPEHRARVAVQPVLENALKLLRGELQHRARLERDFHDMPTVDADEARLTQLFLNLLLNGLQQMDTQDAAHNVLRVAAYTSEDGEVVVEVQDSGKGLSPDALAHIFEPFATSRPNSTGLGLSVSHTIVTGLGGTLRAESREGRGTLLTVTLPAAVPVAEGLRAC